MQAAFAEGATTRELGIQAVADPPCKAVEVDGARGVLRAAARVYNFKIMLCKDLLISYTHKKCASVGSDHEERDHQYA